MEIVLGLLLAIIGGGLQGAFVFPMKFMKNWEWENGWLAYTIVCCLVFPIILAFAFIPGLMDIYRGIEFSVMLKVFLFGVGWGVGSVLFGLGVSWMGMAVAIAIIISINACLGTVFPILFLEAGTFTPTAGILLALGMIILVLGVILISMGAKQRERELRLQDKRIKVLFGIGLIICILSGIFCPMMNFAIFFGKPIDDAVKALGTVSQLNIGYAKLLPAVVGGFFPPAIYCVYLFVKNKSFKCYFQPHSAVNWLRGTLMATLWFVGIILYTIISVKYMPKLGPIVAWPVFLAATILSGNILGILSKEWKGVSKPAFAKLYLGLALLIVAVVVVSMSNVFLPK